MEIKRNAFVCPENHYFDGSTSPICPVCGKVGKPMSGGSFPETEIANGGNANPGEFPPTGAPDMFPPTGDPGVMNESFIKTQYPTQDLIGGYSAIPTTPGEHHESYFDRSNPNFIPTDLQRSGMNVPEKVDPVVGWLVCVDGPTLGTDWRIHAGYNYIGRDSGDIHIHGDLTISREKHAMIAYHAKNNTYHVGPADGRNIIELNDEPIFNATQLHRGDILTIGSTKLLFVPLCDEHFKW